MTDPIFTFHDESNQLEVGIYQETAPKSQQYFTDFEVEVDPDMVVIGGGGVGSVEGALLTACYPRDDLRAWRVSSKDHIHPVSHQLVGYAIGLRINGVSRDTLIRYVHLHQESSEVVPHPEAFAPVNAADSSEICLGGGFKIHWTGAGSLATASFPGSGHPTSGYGPLRVGWTARAKDHIHSSPAYITTYAIGMPDVLMIADFPGIKRIEITPTRVGLNLIDKKPHDHPSDTAWLEESGYVPTCGGAEVFWHGAGSLLWQLEPVVDEKGQFGFRAGAKDHKIPDPSEILASLIGIKASVQDIPCQP